jgi:hypothetical protein
LDRNSCDHLFIYHGECCEALVDKRII